MVDYERMRFAAEERIDLRDWSIRSMKVRRAMGYMGDANGLRVLDVGCGEGALCRTIKHVFPGAAMHGCDVSAAQLERARELGGGVCYAICGDGLPYADKSFDVVFMMDVLEHVSQPPGLLAEIWRVLADGGRVLLHCPCEGQTLTLHWLVWRLGLAAGNFKRDLVGHVQRFSHAEVFRLFRAAAFQRQDVKYSIHPLGQALDLLCFWRQWCDRHVSGGRSTAFQRFMVWLPWYRVNPWLAKVMGVESTIFSRSASGMGIDACFRKGSAAATRARQADKESQA